MPPPPGTRGSSLGQLGPAADCDTGLGACLLTSPPVCSATALPKSLSARYTQVSPTICVSFQPSHTLGRKGFRWKICSGEPGETLGALSDRQRLIRHRWAATLIYQYDNMVITTTN